MGSRIIIFPPLQELKELFGPPLFKQTHQRALDCLYLCTRNLRDLAIAIDKAAGDLLELEITSDISVDKDLSELARRNDELGDKIYGIITIAPQF
jgi:hypothetical protein